MGSNSSEELIIRVRNAPNDLQLANWPLRDDGLSGWVTVLICLGVALLCGYAAQSLLVGILALLALFLSIWRMWIPVTFQFGPRGIQENILGYRRRIAWKDVQSYQVRRKGILLLPTVEPSPLAALRGIYIRWNDQREALLEIAGYYKPSPSVDAHSTTVTSASESIDYPD